MNVRRAFVRLASFTGFLLIFANGTLAQVFFTEGFESGNGNTFSQSPYGTIQGNSQYSVQRTIVANGQYALQHHFNQGQSGTFSTYQFGDSAGAPGATHYLDIYIQFKLRYSDGYDFSAGNNKIMIIGTQDSRRHDTICCNPWVSHYITLYAHTTGTDAYFDVEGNNKRAPSGQWFGLAPNLLGSSRFMIDRNRWYTIEVHLQPNTGSTATGLFEMWIDGTPITRRTDVLYRVPWDGSVGTDPGYGINFVMLSHYINNPAPQAQDMFYDDIILSTRYIGISNSNNTPPAPPHNLRVAQ